MLTALVSEGFYYILHFRALTPLFGNGAGAFRIAKNSVVSTKIGKKYNVLCMKFLCQTDITYK